MAYIFLTSPTSGTASMQRILKTIVGRRRQIVRLDRPASPVEKAGAIYLDPHQSDTIYWFQGPRNWNAEIDIEQFHTIVHFRDPRDLACNQYWWALEHPNERDSPELAEQKRRETESAGIDYYVATNYIARDRLRGLFDIFENISGRAASERATFTSYAQLCVAFDYLVDGLCKVFDTAPREMLTALRRERPENLSANSEWVKVGGTWRGSDVSPGRFRTELREEVAQQLTSAYSDKLLFCQTRDASFLAAHYS